MKNFIYILLFVLPLTVGATEHKIIKIHAPGEFGEDHTLFMNNGEIFEIDKENEALVLKAKEAQKSGAIVNLSLNLAKEEDDLRTKVVEIKSVVKSSTRNLKNTIGKKYNKEYYSPRRSSSLKIENRNPLSNYKLSNYVSYEIAQEVMDSFNGDTHKDSQCYARAHMWTYEAFLKYGDNLGKVWIFFAAKYIREYKYKWWFHVAPFANIQDYSMPMILDRGFTKVPYQLENWKNIFMKNKASCRQIFSYSEYTRNTNREYCFLMFSSAYYWQPQNLEALGRDGVFKWGYHMGELDWSYKNALGKRRVRAPYSRNRESHNAYRRN